MAINPNATPQERPLADKSRLTPDWLDPWRVRFFSGRVIAAPEGSAATLFQAAVFVVGFLLIFSRRPDAILNAQFFAEDGQRWYADAYQFGLRCLLIPDELGGYYHSASRLAALMSLIFPFSLAPLVMNLCAIAIQILPASIFLSSRFSNISLPKRLLIAFVYLALPNSYEVNANATTIQWHLALLAFMLLVAQPAKGWKWRLFDSAALVLISLDSPVGVLLVPAAAFIWWMRRDRWSFTSLASLLPGAAVQASVVLLSHARPQAPNGATFHRLVAILGGQMFLEPLVGNITVLHMAFRHFPNYVFEREILALVIGGALLIYALRYAPVELKLFILFAITVLSLSLARPIPGILPQPQWELLSFPGHGNRYFFLPSTRPRSWA